MIPPILFHSILRESPSCFPPTVPLSLEWGTGVGTPGLEGFSRIISPLIIALKAGLSAVNRIIRYVD